MQRHQLKESIGVLVSERWLADCVNNTPNIGQEEAILAQLLHHDLRDVVQDDAPSEPAAALRHAVEQSKRHTMKLPESFRLLVQVENFSNMAVNSEKRLADGALLSSSRCLKLAFTDGYDEETCFSAIEVTKLPELTISAGIKVIIQGPMTIRNGICGWTATNAIVLGGSVEELVHYYQQSLQRERQRVGHGVDPTVKALIWMNHGEDENDLDESDRASGDIDETIPLQPVNPVLLQRITMPQPTLPLNVSAVPRQAPGLVYNNTTTQSTITNRPSYHEPIRQDCVQPTNPIPRPAQPPPYRGISQAQSLNSDFSHGAPPTIQAPLVSLHPSAFSLDREFPVPQSISPAHTGARSTAGVNPYQRSSSVPLPDSTPPSQAMLSSSQTSTDSTTSRSTNNPYQQRQISRPAPPATSPLEESSSTPIGFLQLRSLLQQALIDPSRIPDIQDKVFTVSMNQVGAKLGFNIERKKTSNSKQYEYVMDAKFGGDSQEEMLITCRVSNSVLCPFFALPPSEMRKLSKINKAHSADLIRDGGKAVMAQIHQVASYHVMVVPMNENTTAKPTVVDGPVPILQILKVD